jgi:hypothetical protein
MNIVALKAFCKETIITYPTLTSEITEYYELALAEIEEGGSEIHECQLAYDDIQTLIYGLAL